MDAIKSRVVFAKPETRASLVEGHLESRGTLDLATGRLDGFVTKVDEDGVGQRSVAVSSVLPPDLIKQIHAFILTEAQIAGQVAAGEIQQATVVDYQPGVKVAAEWVKADTVAGLVGALSGGGVKVVR